MKVLVTGGGGFLGKAIVAKLLERGDAVRSLARGDYPELDAWGVETMRGDLADPEVVMRAIEGRDIVFHVAGKPGMWGPYEAYRLTNLVGTDNVIAACRSHGVPRLVYTSTPSVVHAGGDIEGANESLPYAQRFEGPYPETKAEAERHVLAANDEQLATIAIRPHLIWGPGDNHLIPRLLDRARSGRMRYIGREDKLIDTLYVDNAVDAHLAAGDRLAPGAACAGKAYFVSQGDPWPASRITNAILEAAGLPPVTKRLPVWLAYTVATLADGSDARQVTVVPIANESALRNRDWVEGNIRRVDEATGGRVAYVYVPNTAAQGHTYFKRYFFPQANRQAIIVDERHNGGGQIADYYIDVLARPALSYWATRYGADFKGPLMSIQGPKVMLIDETAGSGGDLLPWMFREMNLGTLIGRRTWGGLVGTLGFPQLMDGGSVTAPNLAFWSKDGFRVENEGVPPDIEVEQWPREVAAGRRPAGPPTAPPPDPQSAPRRCCSGLQAARPWRGSGRAGALLPRSRQGR